MLWPLYSNTSETSSSNKVSQDQRLLTLSLPLFPLSDSLAYSFFLLNSPFRSVRTSSLPFCLSGYLAARITLAFLLALFAPTIFSFVSHHSLLNLTYFPHLLVMVLNVNHLPNNCRYPPDMQESKQRENVTPGSINHYSDNQANCCSNGL